MHCTKDQASSKGFYVSFIVFDAPFNKASSQGFDVMILLRLLYCFFNNSDPAKPGFDVQLQADDSTVFQITKHLSLSMVFISGYYQTAVPSSAPTT